MVLRLTALEVPLRDRVGLDFVARLCGAVFWQKQKHESVFVALHWKRHDGLANAVFFYKIYTQTYFQDSNRIEQIYWLSHRMHQREKKNEIRSNQNQFDRESASCSV